MNCFAKVIYHFKSNIIRYLCFLLTFIGSLASFYFFFSDAAIGVNNYRSYGNPNIDEIWFTESAVSEDCFYNFNGMLFAYSNKKSLNADVLMIEKNVTYKNNFFDITTPLNDGECALSNITAKEYNLAVGSKITVGDNATSFTVSRIFDSIGGLDPKYSHQGVIVLANDQSIIDSHLYTHLLFAKKGGSYVGAISFIKLDIVRQENHKKMIVAMCALVGIISLTIVIEDIFVFRRKEKDYFVLFQDGISKSSLFFTIFLDNSIRTILPIVAMLLIYIRLSFLYTYGYLFVLINILSAALLFVIISTLAYYFRRLRHARIR